MSTGGAGGSGGAGAVGAAAAVGSSGDSGGEGGAGYLGGYDAEGEGELGSSSYLHNYVPNNDVQEASKPEDNTKGKDNKDDKQKPVNVLEDHSDNVAMSEELMDESSEDGKVKTSIWPPRRT
jgi:hypothetical protein